MFKILDLLHRRSAHDVQPRQDVSNASLGQPDFLFRAARTFCIHHETLALNTICHSFHSILCYSICCGVCTEHASPTMDGDPAIEPYLDTFSLILPLPYRIAVIFVLGMHLLPLHFKGICIDHTQESGPGASICTTFPF